MNGLKILIAGSALFLQLSGTAWAEPSAAISAALKDPARPAADTARDAARKPGEILDLAGIKPGNKVVDLIMGGGYFTRILAPAVGPSGHVYAYQPAEFIKFSAKYGDMQKKVVADYKNVTALSGSYFAMDLPAGIDAIITVQNYHDLHLDDTPANTAEKVNEQLFSALKPGGVLLIVDHSAQAGSGLTTPIKLHRIDPAIVKAEVTKAGFKFESESPILRNPKDDLTKGAGAPGIRGSTDQFVYVFRKPA
jgi:predicted methyltransferase